MRDEIKKTDEEIEDIFLKLGVALTIENLVFTRETLEDFKEARKGYNKPGEIEPSRSEGVLVISGAQVLKGQPRRDLIIVDFGTVRAVYA